MCRKPITTQRQSPSVCNRTMVSSSEYVYTPNRAYPYLPVECIRSNHLTSAHITSENIGKRKQNLGFAQ